MMSFDEAKFRAAAKAAGYSDAEIEAELKTPAGSAPPTATDRGPETAANFEKEFQDKKADLEKQFQDQSKEITTTSPMTAAGVLSSPPAWVTGAAVLGAAAGYGIPKIYKSVKDRMMSKTADAPIRIDPIGFESFADMTPTTQAPNPLGQTNLTPEDLQARAAQTRAAIAPVAPEMPVSTPITAAPVDAPAPTPSAAPNSPVTSIVTDTVKEMIQETPEAGKPVAPPQELRTGTGKPAFAGMGPEAAVNKKGQPKLKPEYVDINAVPRGMAFVPNAQYIDTLRQNIGQPDYTRLFTERPFPTTNEMAIQESKDINRMLGRATRAEAKAAGLAPAEITPGITKKTSAGTKPVRVAGTIGALMAISDLAKAETPGQRGMAGANLLEAVLPPGMMMSGAGAGSDVVPDMSQAMMLGSPYAQTEIAKRFRQQQEYQRKVNRAVPPPMR